MGSGLKNALPIFPRTPHLPGSRVLEGDVSVQEESFAHSLQGAQSICLSEKLDGANVRICFDGEESLLVGNREKVLSKSYARVHTTAKIQFRPLWGWAYEHRNPFRSLCSLLHGVPVVFGEWLWAQHTLGYDALPEVFMPYDIWIEGDFLDPLKARDLLHRAGFVCPIQLPLPSFVSVANLLSLAIGPSAYGPTREGAYISLGDGERCTGRFKIVRPDFVPRTDFNDTPLTRNIVKG